MTDGCTAQLAAGAVYDGDTMGVLGTTLVLKAVGQTPIESADGAVYSHLAPDGGRYWAGGASNAGAGVLAAEFPGETSPPWTSALRIPSRAMCATRSPLRENGFRSPTITCPADRRRAREPARGVPSPPRGRRLRRTARSRAAPALGVDPAATSSPGARRPAGLEPDRATVLAPLVPVSVARSASSSVGAAILAAYALTGDRPLTETVDRLVQPPEPVAVQGNSLDDAYQRFVDLVEGSLRHVRPHPAPRRGPCAAGPQRPLGSDPAVTNYGGGNTSAKVTVISPASGEPVELLYVEAPAATWAP